MEVIGLKLPVIEEGAKIADSILDALLEEAVTLENHDIVVVTEKIVAKSQGRIVELATVKPSVKALELAKKIGKDPRLAELIIQESRRIIKLGPNFVITEHRSGVVSANAGIDQSNMPDGFAKLLPEEPDRVALELRRELKEKTDKEVGVILSDSIGRPFRSGSIGIAIGAAGINALWDRRGETDFYGNALESTRVAAADMLASAAVMVMGEAGEGMPAAVIKGVNLSGDGSANDLLRSDEEDVFRN